MTRAKPFEVSKEMVWEAFKDVKANKGAPGVDRQSIEVFEKDLANNLYRIWNRLSSGSYFPPPVRRVEIPKRDGGVRCLGVPTVSDRIAQTVLKKYLEPMVEPSFHPDSYGYRPGKSAHQAVEQAQRRCWRHKWVLELDIKSFFDSLNHTLVMRAVKRFTSSRWVLIYVERWLKAGVQGKDGVIEARDRGTPQGGVVSPLLANIFLHLAFDQWMRDRFPDVPFERYADDVIVHCHSEAYAKWMRTQIEERLRRCRLELHPEKTRVICTDPSSKGCGSRSFDFLGFRFQPRLAKATTGRLFTTFGPAISPKAVKGLREAMRRKWRLPARTALGIEEIGEWINPVLRGWIGYYGRFRPSSMVSALRGLNLALCIWTMRKYKRFKNRPRAAMAWLRGLALRDRELLAHWKIPGLVPTVAER